MSYNVTKLLNGVRVLTVPMPGRDSAAVMVGVKTGGRYETRKLSGVSHFLEHMLFKGTKIVPRGRSRKMWRRGRYSQCLHG